MGGSFVNHEPKQIVPGCRRRPRAREARLPVRVLLNTRLSAAAGVCIKRVNYGSVSGCL